MGDSTQLMSPGVPAMEVAPAGSDGQSEAMYCAATATNSTPHRIPSSCSAFAPFEQQGSGESRADCVTRAPESFIPQMVSFLNKGTVGDGSPAPELRKCFTKPAEACRNDGTDNENDDLVMFEEDIFEAASGRTYVVQDMLGQGTFGQVAKCWCQETGEHVAVKVIKNQVAYYHQARMEIEVLRILNSRCDPEDKHHIVRLHDCFVHKKHLCLVFEMLSINLYELVKHNQFRGFSMNLLRVFMTQILNALVVLRDAHIIHCDLKPENVLLKGHDSGEIKVIDFGSACFANRTVYSYIQSRFYRSPEVLLGHTYTMAIDMWSFGCVAAEMFLGLPLFPGASEYDLLARIIEMLGTPPDTLLARAKHTAKYFATEEQNGAGRLRLRSQQEFAAHIQQAAPVGKRYFKHSKLADIIGAYPMRPGMTDTEMGREHLQREAFLDLLLGVLELEPSARWSPRQALQHPFFTGQEFTGPFQPQADPIRTQPVNLSSTPPLQIPGGGSVHMSPMTHNGPYVHHANSWAPGTWGGNHAGSVGASSLGTGLGGVALPGSWAAMSSSPAMVQMHAHAAAMAAISQMSPQMSPLAPGGAHGSFHSGHNIGGLPQGSLGFGHHGQPPLFMGNHSHGGSPMGTHMPLHHQQASMAVHGPMGVSMSGATNTPTPRMMDAGGHQHKGLSPVPSLGSHQQMMGLQQHSYHSAIAHAAAVQAMGRSAPQVGYAYSTSPGGVGAYGGTPTQHYMQQAFGSLSGSQAMSAASIAAAMAARNCQYAPQQVAQAAAQAAFHASSGSYNSLPTQMGSHGFVEQQSPGYAHASNMAGSFGGHQHSHHIAAAAASMAIQSQGNGGSSSTGWSSFSAHGLGTGVRAGQGSSAGASWHQPSQMGCSERQVMSSQASVPPLGVSPNSLPIPAMTPSFPANPDAEILPDSPEASASPEPGDPADYLPWFSDDQLIEEPSSSSRRRSRDRRPEPAPPPDLDLPLDRLRTLTLEPCASGSDQVTSSSVPDEQRQGSTRVQWTPRNGAPHAPPKVGSGWHRGSHPPGSGSTAAVTPFPDRTPAASAHNKADSSKAGTASTERPPELVLSPGLPTTRDED